MVPIFAGVIVAGLGIGALLSAFASRRAPTPAQTATPIVVEHTPTPIAQRSVAVATAPPTPQPTATAAKPSAAPSPKPTPKPTVAATAKPTPKPTPKPTVAATAKPTARPAPPPPPTIAPVAIRTAPPVRTAAPVRAAAPAATPSPPRVAQIATPVPTDPLIGNSQSLVRRYLDAVAHGDDAGAFSALGGQSGNRLVEQPFLDPTMRITSITASPNPSGGAKVQVELTTARGLYFGTYSVDSSGTRITDHAIIPVGGTTSR